MLVCIFGHVIRIDWQKKSCVKTKYSRETWDYLKTSSTGSDWVYSAYLTEWGEQTFPSTFVTGNSVCLEFLQFVQLPHPVAASSTSCSFNQNVTVHCRLERQKFNGLGRGAGIQLVSHIAKTRRLFRSSTMAVVYSTINDYLLVISVPDWWAVYYLGHYSR